MPADALLLALSAGAALLLPLPGGDGRDGGGGEQQLLPTAPGTGAANGSAPGRIWGKGGGRPGRRGMRPRGLRGWIPWPPPLPPPRTDLPPLRLGLLVSLCLLALGVLEAVPPAGLLLLRRSGDGAGFSGAGGREWRVPLSAAYRLLLWADCALIGLAAPAALGAGFGRRLSPGGGREGAYLPAPGAAPPARASARILLIVLLPARLLLGLAAALLRPLASLVLPGRSGRRQHGSGPAPAAAGPHRPTPAAAGAALGAGLSFLSLRALGRIVVARTGGAAPGLLGAAVAHVAALGVLLSAAFGGFGSAALPHGCLEGMHLPPDLPALAVARVEEEARAAEGEAAARERTLAEAGTGAGAAGGLAVVDGGGDLGTGGGGGHGGGGALSYLRQRCRGGAGYSAEDARARALAEEVSLLRTLAADLNDEAEELRRVRESVRRANTPLGRAMAWAGRAFSAILLVRVALAAASILGEGSSGGGGGGGGRTDPITLALSFLMGHELIDGGSYHALSQLASLLLTAVLSLSQLRTFHRTAAALHRKMGCLWRPGNLVGNGGEAAEGTKGHRAGGGGSDGGWSSALAWAATSVTGSFFLSCLVLTKLNLPERHRREFAMALGGIDFAFSARATNAVFVASALVSASVLAVLFGIRRQASSLHRIGTPMDVHRVSSSSSLKLGV